MQGAEVLGRKFQVGPPLVGYSTGQLPEPRGPAVEISGLFKRVATLAAIELVESN